MNSPFLFSPEEMRQRLSQVRTHLAALALDAVIATDPANVRYLTGFKGEPRALIVTPHDFRLVTAFRTLPWAEEQTRPLAGVLELETHPQPAEAIFRRLPSTPLTLGIDQSISARNLAHWRETLSPHSIVPQPVIEHVRRLKSPAEVALMAQSQQINEAILAAVLPQIRPDMTERGVQGLLLAEMAHREDVDAFSFNPIVAAGANCWEIHHLPDHSVIGKNQILLIDLGVIHQGYASDMTRTICLGQATQHMREIHHLVTTALEAALGAATVGRTNRELDQVARQVITEAGHGEVFTHGLGHHIGLETHDPAPPLSQGAPEIPLEAGMTLTLEPGVYLQNQFGVRTEDVVVLTEDRPINLTRPSHGLLEVVV